ncbi:SMI1/KNR4 family protein [Streptomyces sp. BYX5S]
MDETTFDWRRFLGRWSEEWSDARRDAVDLSADDEESVRDRWLGFDPAPQERITALERRLGRELPPSYREFLRISDGWQHAGNFVWRLAGTEQAHWHEDAMGLGSDFDTFWGEEGNTPEVRAQVGLWSRALRLDAESDMVFVLLDPEDVGPDGEWAVRTWASWRAADPDRYPSFAAFMVAMHQEFHRFAAEAGTGFANDTTRAQDAAVDRARTAALRGRHEEAAGLLREAARYGRPGAASMLRQLETVRGGGAPGVPSHPADPGYLTDLLPLAAAHFAVGQRGSDPAGWHHANPGIFPDTAEAAADLLRRMLDGTYEYRPGGAFGEAVNAAREAARWGDTTTAWRLLREGLPSWRPLGPDQLAPLGLLADPLLAPALTAERRLELLATARGDERDAAGEPAREPRRVPEPLTAPEPEPEPDGLSWVVRPGLRPNQPGDVRFVLVEGAAPDALPELLGAAPGATLTPPLRAWDVRRHHRPAQRSFTSDEDLVLLRVGRAGPGWSFGIDEDPPASYLAERFVSPALAASAGGRRAIVVWCGQRWGRVTLHVSAARDGKPLYGFTARAGMVESRSGEIPAELAPERLGFTTATATTTPATGPGTGPGPAQEEQVSAAVRALDALAGLYRVGLPRLALTAGRLHSFEAAPWVRSPAPGEPHATLAFVRHRSGGSPKGR